MTTKSIVASIDASINGEMCAKPIPNKLIVTIPITIVIVLNCLKLLRAVEKFGLRA